mmetsp:Transcript_17364/g.19796  ORF Transcript_17364/g.19796 Transcript_17364/m.19796 type:complete len:219 (-) Transcript_17364:53-709(-)|eukprot:CAMPEP_0176422116 /NCGR_PEP_ID=MMETSP0127-20121128/9556_1 /TAXON_ID=938130 /ORGANISM="Platyophrya macrostoma, Strain WH" /LENGTH=218 /DNA_ID=CAMNT_0017802933 /DNA_START=47 /DNA_END=706 /DNA_ORIENTATION=+
MIDDESPESKAIRTLWESIVTGKEALAKKLLDQIGIPINGPLTATGTKPLHQAILSGRDGLAKEFVERYQCDVNITDNNSRSALHFAAACGNLDMIKYLVSHGADVNAQTIGGETPAMKACMAGEENCVNEFIFSYRCNLALSNACGKTLLDLYPLYMGKLKYEALVERLFALEIIKRETLMEGAQNEGSIRMELEEEQKNDYNNNQNYPNNQMFFNS